MKSEKFTLTKHISFGRFIKMSMLSALLTIWYSGLQAQPANCPLACNNLVQVSMDEDCIVPITPDMMLEGQGLPGNCTYVVQVLGANGQPLQTSPNVTSANIGQTLTVRVWLGANSCWGTIKVEDKLAPEIDCPAPITISCWDPRTFTNPPATDNCNGLVSVTLLSDVTTELDCNNVNRAVRVMKYQAKDASGNLSAICERVVTYSRITLLDIKFPKNYDGTEDNRPHLQCDGGWAWNPYKTVNTVPFPTLNWDKNNNKYPDPDETGAPYVADPLNITGYILGYQVGPSPTGTQPRCTSGNLVGYDIATGTWITQCDGNTGLNNVYIDTFYNAFIGNNTLCKINTTYSDTKIDICPNSYKILRYWTVLDWCTGGISNKYQIIKVVDDEAPVVTCPADLTSSLAPVLVAGIIAADPYTCTGTWQVRPPVTISDCNATTWTVKIKKADNTGNDPGDGVPFVTQDGDTRVTGTYPNFVIEGLPLGRTWVQYLVKDACGNVGECRTEVDVFDTTPPVPVCDEFTVVTLSNNGWAHVFAETFDDGSHDNCTDVTFDVRRMTPGCGASTTAWAPFVQICCEDVGREVMVELRVTDAFGNRNTCMVIVNAQDKVPPVITCPVNVTINCGADTSSTVLGRPVYSATPLATPYFTDNCPNPKLTWRNSGVIDNCGQGVITRTFTVTDNGGRTATCSQTITIRNTTPYNGPTTWPLSPVEVTGCMNVDTDPSKTGVPVLGNGACSLVAYTYEDQVFPFVDGVCFKILRKWTVIDWCKFAPNRDVNGALYPGVPTTGVNMWVYTQIIKVSENVKPVLATCSKADTDAFGDNCTGFVDLKNSATDCTPAAQLRWTYVIDPNNDGVAPFINGTTNDASGTYPVGTHKITWTVEDMCGNQATCNYTFKVVDKKKPTPYCISELTTVVMPTTGSISIWAKDFDKGSSDNCPGKLWFTFAGARPVASKLTVEHYFKGNGLNATQAEFESGIAQLWRPADCSSSKLYTCDDLGQNSEDMSVWDVSGNTDYCTVTLNVQANGTACTGSRMAGNIGTETNEMIKDVQVALQNMNSNEIRSYMTDAQGHFEFVGMPEEVGYKITPEKNTDHLNGVSTLDLVMIQRHILGIEKFNTAYKHVAGDVNKDNKITAGDLVELRKLILGIYSEFPNNKSWRFLDKAVVISDIANPWGVNDYISINNFNASVMNNNFIGVKVGDINGSATTNANTTATETRSKALTFTAEDQTYQSGQNVRMDISADNFENIAGAQWTINFDASSMEFTGVAAGELNMGAENVNVREAKEGKLAFSWNDFKGFTVGKDKVLFTIEFRATANNTIANTVKLSSDITKAEAYTHDLSEINLALKFRNNNASEEVFGLDQNNPNPFTASTTIGFTLPAAGKAKLTIYDITGKVLKTISNVYPKGRNEIVISTQEINAQGVMFYELESNGVKATKKMIYLNK